MIQKAIMLSCDLMIITALFGMTGYYYTANQIGAGEWYALQYDVDLLATNIQTAATINGEVTMKMSLPPNSYISIVNDDLINPSYGMVIGQQVQASRTFEWAILNAIIEQTGEYNSRGFAFSPVTNGLATLIKYQLTEKSEVAHVQITAPTLGATIRNTDRSLFNDIDPDTATTFYLTLNGSQRAERNGYYYNVVSIEHSTTPPEAVS